MSKDKLLPKHINFIADQHVFFVATSPKDGGFINLSPKGLNSFRVLDEKTVLWLNLTGSGNETAAHILEDDRMTIMFCAFEGSPLILRLYGHCRAVHQYDEEWHSMYSQFDPIAGARQIMVMRLSRVATSCGYGVPYLEYSHERTEMRAWAEKKGEEGIKEYWKSKNEISLDGKPTRIFG
ncbi:MAG: pyridoxamine 5'-phosphate oxidase family protein [Bacteroidetes bacterium]|nr:pyridoxamine 5'-phosphate oxidase family protein [Bacteroidota bacterium]